MEEQVYQPKGEDEVVRGNSPINSSVQCRGMASNSNTNEKADGNHLGGSRGGSSKQIRMASKCGPMHPFGCGLNQGQGQD